MPTSHPYTPRLLHQGQGKAVCRVCCVLSGKRMMRYAAAALSPDSTPKCMFLDNNAHFSLLLLLDTLTRRHFPSAAAAFSLPLFCL